MRVLGLRRTVLYGVLIVFAIVYIGPFVIQLMTSFKTDPDATNHSLSLVPDPFTLSAWKRIFGAGTDSVPIVRWLGNSVLIAGCITIGRIVLDSLAAYALARLQFPGRKLVLALVIGTLAVPPVVLLIPRFLILKEFGLFDSYTGMILPIAADAGGIFIMRGFFLQVPSALEEAARIDGAGAFRTFWSVVLPNVRAGLITLTILSFQSSWNEFAFYQVANTNPDHFTLTTGLANMAAGGIGRATEYPLNMGASLIATIPVAILFFAFQRRFVRTDAGAAVKG